MRSKQPKLSDKQQWELRRMHDSGDYSVSDLAELFTVSRLTVYRTLARNAPSAPGRTECRKPVSNSLEIKGHHGS